MFTLRSRYRGGKACSPGERKHHRPAAACPVQHCTGLPPSAGPVELTRSGRTAPQALLYPVAPTPPPSMPLTEPPHRGRIHLTPQPPPRALSPWRRRRAEAAVAAGEARRHRPAACVTDRPPGRGRAGTERDGALIGLAPSAHAPPPPRAASGTGGGNSRPPLPWQCDPRRSPSGRPRCITAAPHSPNPFPCRGYQQPPASQQVRAPPPGPARAAPWPSRSKPPPLSARRSSPPEAAGNPLLTPSPPQPAALRLPPGPFPLEWGSAPAAAARPFVFKRMRISAGAPRPRTRKRRQCEKKKKINPPPQTNKQIN